MKMSEKREMIWNNLIFPKMSLTKAEYKKDFFERLIEEITDELKKSNIANPTKQHPITICFDRRRLDKNIVKKIKNAFKDWNIEVVYGKYKSKLLSNVPCLFVDLKFW